MELLRHFKDKGAKTELIMTLRNSKKPLYHCRLAPSFQYLLLHCFFQNIRQTKKIFILHLCSFLKPQYWNYWCLTFFLPKRWVPHPREISLFFPHLEHPSWRNPFVKNLKISRERTTEEGCWNKRQSKNVFNFKIIYLNQFLSKTAI